MREGGQVGFGFFSATEGVGHVENEFAVHGIWRLEGSCWHGGFRADGGEEIVRGGNLKYEDCIFGQFGQRLMMEMRQSH